MKRTLSAKKVRREQRRKERLLIRGISSCLMKVRYATIFEAERGARIYRQKVYHCRLCSGYHLTKKK